MSKELTSKAESRRRMRGLLAKTSENSIQSASQEICVNLVKSSIYEENARVIAVYSAHGVEVSLSTLHQLSPQKQLLYPLCHDRGRLTFHHVSDPRELKPGKLGILEPNPDLHREVAIPNIDLFLCPGLAFSKNGSRLGHGGGYYDRALMLSSGRSIGVAMDCQILDLIPSEEHDMAMDYLVSESGLRATRPH